MVRRVVLALVLVVVIASSAAVAVAASAPVLAGSNKPYGAGFGSVRPRTIWLGGDESGLVCFIHWLTWGRSLAVGMGVGWYVGPRQATSQGHLSPAVVVLSDLGPWHGRSAYRRFRWYFPEPRVTAHPKRRCL